MLNLDQVTLFVAAADKGSFSAAARLHRKSVSTVSLAVSNLEKNLNVELFDRSSKYPKLTEQGEQLYELAQLLLRQANRIQSVANSLINQVEEEVSIGLDELAPFQLVEDHLTQISKKFPDTKLRLTRERAEILVEQLHSNQLDIILAANNSTHGANQLTEIQLVGVCAKQTNLFDPKSVDFEQLKATRQILCESVVKLDILNDALSEENNSWSVTSIEDLMQLVEEDFGWALAPMHLAREYAKQDKLVIFDCPKPLAELTLNIGLEVAPDKAAGPVVSDLLAMFNSNDTNR
ncbi:LysR family transcriptional regulator [Paraferrimonas sedimenticola]|uniref:LysR family transcriptional regulator n=1 Tax=Paraferrimonas sedimenticola TaxID=375674 RepID=A0AA37RV73_9GAMM|nr:LysR family transcriptional regulator [Paraferrimonas sedimenticola]GLP96051.1 LysR family transcriptional regulator [Paraferrimonas sedimenticola]